MSWTDTITRLFDLHGESDAFDYALATELATCVDQSAFDNVEELQTAVALTWIGVMSPVQVLTEARWRSLFDMSGQIAFHRAIPLQPTVVYRWALPDWRYGWSWSTDPRSVMCSNDISPSDNFKLIKWAMPNHRWYRTTVAPSAIRLAVPHGRTVKGRGVARLSTDELVIDPQNLGRVDSVPFAEMIDLISVGVIPSHGAYAEVESPHSNFESL